MSVERPPKPAWVITAHFGANLIFVAGFGLAGALQVPGLMQDVQADQVSAVAVFGVGIALVLCVWAGLSAIWAYRATRS